MLALSFWHQLKRDKATFKLLLKNFFNIMLQFYNQGMHQKEGQLRVRPPLKRELE